MIKLFHTPIFHASPDFIALCDTLPFSKQEGVKFYLVQNIFPAAD